MLTFFMINNTFKFMFKKMLIIAAFFLLCLSSVFSENNEKRTISYDEAFALFHERGSELKIADLNRKMSKRDEAVSLWLPSLNVSGTLMSGSGSYTPNTIDWNWSNVRIGGTLSLSIGAANFINSINRTLAQSVADYNYEKTASSLEQTFFTLYWSVSSAKSAAMNAQNSFDVAKEVLLQTEERYDAGLVSSLELMNAKLSAANAQQTVVELESAYTSAYLTLKSMIKEDEDFEIEEIKAPAFVSFPAVDDLYMKFLSSNQTVKTLSYTYKTSKNNASSAKYASLLPSFTFSLGYNYAKDLIAGVADDSMTFSINAALPLDGYFPGTATNATIQKAEDARKIAKLNLDEGYRTFRNDIEKNINSIQSLEMAYKTSVEQMELAEESYKLSKESYDNGKLTMSEYDKAQNALLGARLALLNANVNYQSALYKFAVYLGIEYEQFMKSFLGK